MISKLREKLYKAIYNYGLNSLVTLEISKKLDKEIVKEQFMLVGGDDNE